MPRCDICGKEKKRIHYIVEKNPHPKIVNICYHCLKKRRIEKLEEVIKQNGHN